MPEAPRRPASVTLACLFVGFSSLLILVNLMSLLGDWGSLSMQEGLESVLETEPLASSSLTMDQLLTWLRIAAQAVVVLAVAATIFAIYAARGHEASRWVLTVLLGLGALVFAASGFAGLLPGVVTVLCAMALWTRDARRWFAEKNGRPVPQKLRPGRGQAPPAAQPPASSQGPGQSTPGQGAPTVGVQTQAPSDAASPAAGRRPRALEIAVWLTVISCAVAAVVGVLGLVALTLGEDAYRQSLEEPGFVRDVLQGSGWTTDAMILFLRLATAGWVVLGVIGAVVALWARSGQRAGWVALLVMSIVGIVASVLFLPAGVLNLAAAIVVLVQLNKRQTRQWVAARSSS
ncbi:hypothetical protein [Aeromicrobium sp. CTD01-1L150]|uniref:hypothetical protein n=1 Tax=Aeromicrobium sp. CTD01-1L150 TaxID=3341830 RepID=UPI0035BF2A5E